MSLKSPVDSLTKNVEIAWTGQPRNPRWETTRRQFIVQHPQCEVCAGPSSGQLNVHHIIPYDVVVRCGRPDLELDFRNLITLCESGEKHHFVVGHLCDERSYNRHVRRDVLRADCRGQTSDRITRMRWWQERQQDRSEHELSATDVDSMKHVLDNLYPLGGAADMRLIEPDRTPAAELRLRHAPSDRRAGPPSPRSLGGDVGVEKALAEYMHYLKTYLLILIGWGLLVATVFRPEWMENRPFLGFQVLGLLLLAFGLRSRL